VFRRAECPGRAIGRCELDRQWLFSGVGQHANISGGFLSDLWSYDPSIGQWSRQSGAVTGNTLGVYRILGVAAAPDAPDDRLYSMSWNDGANHLWMFGGYGYGSSGGQSNINDLWV
jgi:hypothetical protein